jgi:hypothetical protein
MLSNKGLYEELEKFEGKIKAGKADNNDILKAFCLLLKLVHNIRTNQTAVMEKLGVEKLQPKARDEQKKVQ